MSSPNAITAETSDNEVKGQAYKAVLMLLRGEIRGKTRRSQRKVKESEKKRRKTGCETVRMLFVKT